MVNDTVPDVWLYMYTCTNHTIRGYGGLGVHIVVHSELSG
jgi:hypothetical protein